MFFSPVILPPRALPNRSVQDFIRYPANAKKNGIEGKVIISYYLDKEGIIDTNTFEVINGFVKRFDSESSVVPSSYYAPVGAIEFYTYYRTFDVTLDGEDVGFISVEFTNTPAKDSQGRSWKEREEDLQYSRGYSRYSISEYQAKRLYENAEKSQTIDGARFKFVQGFIGNNDEEHHLYLQNKNQYMRPFKDRYNKMNSLMRDRAVAQGFVFTVKDIGYMGSQITV